MTTSRNGSRSAAAMRSVETSRPTTTTMIQRNVAGSVMRAAVAFFLVIVGVIFLVAVILGVGAVRCGFDGGFGFFLASEISRQIGVAGLAPAWAAVWLPVALLLIISSSVLLHQEDG